MSEGAAKKGERPRKFQAIRGTRDLLPPDTALWNHVEQTAREVFSTYGFGEIRPPIFESTELFARSIGEETDVVAKEMYTFEDYALPGFEEDRGELLAAEIIDLESVLYLPSNLNILVSRLRRAKADAGLGEENDAVVEELIALEARTDFGRLVQNFTKELPDSFDMLDNALREVKYLVRKIVLGNVVTLRPEATASVCRAYIEHNMQQLPQPVKLYYMGPMFRRERPQKGRYRQFYQIGAEILGGPDAPAIDAELIEMLMTFFSKCGLQGAELDINSIGHSAPPVDGKNVCRRAYVAKLKAELEKVKDQLGADSQRRIETNPLRVLDSKLEHEQPIIEKLPRIADHLCDECKSHYAAVKRELDLRGVAYRENWRLVRGLDYYMRTTFEITAQGLGSQNAVCGGGRYDGLVELLGGPPTKGIGFAIGEDRLILSLQESGKSPAAHGRDIYIAWMGQNAYATAIRAAKTLRSAGLSVELPPVEQKLGKALERASKLNARFALILGDDEVASGQWTLKTLADGSQQKLTGPALLEYLRKP
ncbi:MAG TPA: histidine--tRNA ligase [Candidatus Solibacter sp.]|nr:histidine--tRNA ligase [Candidatus Solibacter sp.]